jgi:hypothetical protein
LGSAGQTETYEDATQASLDSVQYAKITQVDPEAPITLITNPQDQYTSGLYVSLTPGTGVWILLKTAKQDFIRVGTSEEVDPTLNWSTISAIEIDIKNVDTTSGTHASTVYFDEFNLESTGHLFGVDYEWTYTYYNSLTGTESDYADPIDVPAPGANYSQFRLSFPVCPVTTPPNADPDQIRIYRMGGTITQMQLVNSAPIAYTPGVAPSDYIDDVGDNLLQDILLLQ